jgi:hypothetical protein
MIDPDKTATITLSPTIHLPTQPPPGCPVGDPMCGPQGGPRFGPTYGSGVPPQFVPTYGSGGPPQLGPPDDDASLLRRITERLRRVVHRVLRRA